MSNNLEAGPSSKKKKYSDIKVEDNAKIVCSSCEVHLSDPESVYRCTSCVNDGSSSFCELCITNHVRRKHKVVDSRRREPSVCEHHGCLNKHFCSTCSVVFCSECLYSHNDHKYLPVREKAKELRTSTFQDIDHFDYLTKNIKLFEQNQLDALKVSKSSPFRNSSDDVTNKFLEIVRFHVERCLPEKAANELDKVPAGCTKLTDTNIQDLYEVIRNADSLGEQLRNCLSCSDGNLISKYYDLKPEVDGSIRKQKQMLEMFICCRPLTCEDSLSYQHVVKLVEELLKVIKWPQVFLIPVMHMHCCKRFFNNVVLFDSDHFVAFTDHEMGFVVSPSKDEAVFTKFYCGTITCKRFGLYREKLNLRSNSVKFSSIRHVHSIAGISALAIFTIDKIILVDVLKERKEDDLPFPEHNSIELTSSMQPLRSLRCFRTNSIYLIYWDAVDKKIKRSDDHSDVIPVIIENKLVLFCNSDRGQLSGFSALYTESNELIIHNPKSRLLFTLKSHEHGLKKIDGLEFVTISVSSYEAECCLLLWNLDSRTFVLLRNCVSLGKDNWCVDKVFRVKLPDCGNDEEKIKLLHVAVVGLQVYLIFRNVSFIGRFRTNLINSGLMSV